MRFLLCLFVFLFVVAATPWPAEAALSETDKKVYADAFRRADKKDYPGAHRLAARGSEPLLGEFFAWLELTRTKGDGDFAELSAFLDSHPGWPRLGEIRRRAEESLPDGLTPAELLAWFGEESPSTVDGALRLAEALRADGQEVAATPLLRETWVTGRFTRSQEGTFLDRYRDLLRRDDEMARLETLLERRSVAAARRQARRLGSGYPELAEASHSRARGRPGGDQPIGRLPGALQNDPGLLYERARWRKRRGRTEGVIGRIDRAGPGIRRPERWWRLRHWAARRAFGEGDIATAYRLANGHDLKKGTGFADGEWLAGWIALRFLDDPKRAYDHFVRLHDGVGTPISLARGAYWAAEAAAALGDEENATRWYRRASRHATAFYGQLASARLGEPLDLDLGYRVAPGPDAKASFEDRDLVRLLRLLGAFDQRKHQETFLGHLRRQAHSDLEYDLVAALAVSVGRPDQALLTATQPRRKVGRDAGGPRNERRRGHQAVQHQRHHRADKEGVVSQVIDDAARRQVEHQHPGRKQRHLAPAHLAGVGDAGAKLGDRVEVRRLQQQQGQDHLRLEGPVQPFATADLEERHSLPLVFRLKKRRAWTGRR